MRTTIELPEAVYQQSAEHARKLGLTVDELIAQLLEREFPSTTPPRTVGKRIESPLIRSRNPGTLDLTNFNFDDLLS